MTDAEVRGPPTGDLAVLAETAPYKAALQTPAPQKTGHKSPTEAPATPTGPPPPPPQPAGYTTTTRSADPPSKAEHPPSGRVVSEADAQALEAKLKEVATPSNMAVLYSVLSVAYIALGSLLLVVPGMMTRLLFGSAAYPVEAQHLRILRLVGGAGGFAAAGASTALAVEGGGGWGKNAVRETGYVLRMGLATLGALNLFSTILYPATMTPWAGLAALGFNLAATAIPSMHLLASRDSQEAPSPIMRVLSRRSRSPLAALLTLLTILYPLAGWAFFLAPKYTLYHLFGYSYGKSAFLLWKMAGVADITLMPAVLLALKSAAQSGWMCSPGAVALSAGSVMAGLAHMAVLLPLLIGSPITGWLMPGAVGMWGVCLLASVACLVIGLSDSEAEASAKMKKRE